MQKGHLFIKAVDVVCESFLLAFQVFLHSRPGNHHEPFLGVRIQERDDYDPAHFTDALVYIRTVLNLANLTDGELENTSFSLFICDLLSSNAEGSLGLNGGLLDLDQNLRHNTLNVLENKTVTRITTFRSVSSEREAMLHAVWVIVDSASMHLCP
jgi:hypothetical protein